METSLRPDDTLHVSHPSADGGVAVLAVPAGSAVTVTFVDEPEPRDITALVPDLLLIGLTLLSAEQPDLDDQVTVGEVGWVGEPPTMLFCHPGGRFARLFPFTEVVGVLELAVAAQIAAGVAEEAGGS